MIQQLEAPPGSSASPEPQEHDPAIEHLLDMPVKVEVILGDAFLSLRAISELAPGSLIRGDRAAGDRVGFSANGVVIAAGEVMPKGDMLGIRLSGIQLQD